MLLGIAIDNGRVDFTHGLFKAIARITVETVPGCALGCADWLHWCSGWGGGGVVMTRAARIGFVRDSFFRCSEREEEEKP